MKNRLARMGSTSAAYAAIVFVAVAAVAVVSARHSHRWDLTRDGSQSLSAETLRIVESIPKGGSPLEIMAVTSYTSAPGGDPRQAENQVRPLLELFAKASSQIKTSIVFAENEPMIVEQLGIDKMPMVVLRWTPPAGASGNATGEASKQRERRTDLVTEQGIAQALAELLEGRRRQAFLLTGHDEMRRDDDGPTGMSRAAAIFAGANLDMHDLLLAGPADIPLDADLVVIAAPETDLLPNELTALEHYASRGGRLLVLHGPQHVAGRFPQLENWLKTDWGIACFDGIVADVDAPFAGNFVTLLIPPDPDAKHAIVHGFGKIVEVAATRKLAQEVYLPDGVVAEPLLTSGPRSWLETDLSTQTPHFDESDLRGPHVLALAVTKKPPGQEKEARLVMFGSRLLVSNLFVGEVGNSDLLRNTLSWLAGRDTEIAERAGKGQDGTVVMARSQGFLILGTTLAIPLIIALSGFATWWWRRRL